jgi:hypothetical protein
MKQVSEATTDVWLSGDYTGANRPMARVTIQKWHMHKTDYKVRWSDSAEWKHEGKFRSALFNTRGPVRELRNLKSVSYDRSVDTDVASCRIELYNVQYRKDMENPNDEELDFPGWFTPTRGDFDRWDYTSNRWHDWIRPDRLIKTFEGYGVDASVPPEDDPDQYPSGVWLIDTVTFGTDGIITLECRDLGSILLSQIMFPPVVPWQAYPLWFDAFHWEDPVHHFEPSGGWISPTYDSDSNSFALAAGLEDGFDPAVSPDGSVYGHEGADAADGTASTYWLSAGSADPDQLEWIEFTKPAGDVTGLKINAHGGPYKVYISLNHQGKGWRGAGKIRYKVGDDMTDNGADIPYVKDVWIGKDNTIKIVDFNRTFKDVTKIRLTFAPRWRSGIGPVRNYRAALQQVSYAEELTRVEGTENRKMGNYGDYTTIIKYLLAWAGFFWPPNATIRKRFGIEESLEYAEADAKLPKGRVWGDMMLTKTTGFMKLDVDVWDKKPFMDGISAIRDIVGFDFWIDETGAAVWRMPNVLSKGNYLMPAPGGVTRNRTSTVIEIDERTTLIDLSATLSSANVRERVMVADVNGNFGTVVEGYNPAPTGLKRVAGWTDQHFRNRRETRIMAELIAYRQAYNYRTCTITIAANPALQVDDQVIIYERMSGEGFLHRIKGISSQMDFETGKWTYTLTTNWLGDAAFTNKAWEPPLSEATQAFLSQLGG